jgi:hypothetical protein
VSEPDHRFDVLDAHEPLVRADESLNPDPPPAWLPDHGAHVPSADMDQLVVTAAVDAVNPLTDPDEAVQEVVPYRVVWTDVVVPADEVEDPPESELDWNAVKLPEFQANDPLALYVLPDPLKAQVTPPDPAVPVPAQSACQRSTVYPLLPQELVEALASVPAVEPVEETVDHPAEVETNEDPLAEPDEDRNPQALPLWVPLVGVQVVPSDPSAQ